MRRCLEKDPADRFQTYSEFIDALLPPTEPIFPAARAKAESSRAWFWPAAAAAGLTLLAVMLAAIFSAEMTPPAAEAQAPLPRVSVAAPLPEKKEPAPPELKPVPPPRVPPAKVAGPALAPLDPAAGAAEALHAFRSSLASEEESELIGEIPWGTWRPDLFHAPGGEARFDPEARVCVLTARRESDRAWIKRPFAGAKAGYQVRFRLASGGSARLAVMLSFTRWVELWSSGAVLYWVAVDGTVVPLNQAAFASPADGGVVSVVPRSSETLFFFDDRLLFIVPEADAAPAEGLQLGAGGGTVLLTSVRVKDRSK